MGTGLLQEAALGGSLCWLRRQRRCAGCLGFRGDLEVDARDLGHGDQLREATLAPRAGPRGDLLPPADGFLRDDTKADRQHFSKM